ncbi:MAG: GlxA family transcriptional regulator [Pseudomonadota bacterium]
MPALKPRPNLSVGFILTHRFTLGAFANFVDVLRLAADEGDRSRPIKCRWRVLSHNGAPVRSSCGVAVQPDAPLSDPLEDHYLVVVGGLIDETARLDEAYVAFLKRASAQNVPLVGVCTGAFVLHAAGLMEGYRCCVSWFHRDDFLESFGGVEPVSDQIFVVDRDRITCSGGASSAHLAAHLVARHVGEGAARKSLNIMMIDEAMAAEKPQPERLPGLTTDDALVRRALKIMADALPATLTVERLAHRLGLSRRQLERRFQSALSLSPGAAARRVRLSAAKRQLEATTHSLARIAAETGFSDGAHLIRTFRNEMGQTPAVWRSRQRALRS